MIRRFKENIKILSKRYKNDSKVTEKLCAIGAKRVEELY
jgi:hypothetical protein